MKTHPKTRSLRSIWAWSKQYLEQADALLKSDDIESMMRLRDELWDFAPAVQQKSRIDMRLSAQTKSELLKLYDDLRRGAQALANRIAEVRRNKEIMKRLERTANPEPIEGVAERDFLAWAAGPIGFSSRLQSKLANARLPQ